MKSWKISPKNPSAHFSLKYQIIQQLSTCIPTKLQLNSFGPIVRKLCAPQCGGPWLLLSSASSPLSVCFPWPDGHLSFSILALNKLLGLQSQNACVCSFFAPKNERCLKPCYLQTRELNKTQLTLHGFSPKHARGHDCESRTRWTRRG